MVAGLVPLAMALPTTSLDISRVVGMAFAVAASTFCPLLVLGIWWRGLTTAGAIAGLIVGGGLSLGALVTSVAFPGVLPEPLDSLLGQPAVGSVPAAFADDDRWCRCSPGRRSRRGPTPCSPSCTCRPRPVGSTLLRNGIDRCVLPTVQCGDLVLEFGARTLDRDSGRHLVDRQTQHGEGGSPSPVRRAVSCRDE